MMQTGNTKKSITKALGAVALSVALAMPGAAFAAADPLVEGAKLCTQYFPVEEQRNSIPTHLLAAIATTESGRWHSGLGMNVPWPWTVNVDGKGYYYDSKAEAMAQVQRFQSQGHESIDVGCMQVNLKHHPRAFANLDEAFDPRTNVAYAAKFLHDNYADLGDWIKATAAYHSRTPVYGQQYLGEIERSWNRIVAKVAAARAGTSSTGTAVAATTAPAETPARPVMAAHSEPVMRPIASTHHVRDIKISDANTARRSDVLVIRPQPQPQSATPVRVADATPNATPVVAAEPVGDSVRHVSFESAPAETNGSTRFVFAN